jgi:hypothetical protein
VYFSNKGLSNQEINTAASNTTIHRLYSTFNFANCPKNAIYLWIELVLGFKSMVSQMLGKSSTTELHEWPSLYHFNKKNHNNNKKKTISGPGFHPVIHTAFSCHIPLIFQSGVVPQMTQALYAHMNNKTIKIKKNKKEKE